MRYADSPSPLSPPTRLWPAVVNAGRRASIRESVKKFNPFASLQRLQNPQKYGEETTPAADLIGRWIICPIYFIVMMVYCVDRGSGVKPWFPERTGDE